MGYFGATAVSIGGIIGSGIFFILGIAAGVAGPAVVLSLFLAGIVAMLTALSFACLSSRITKEGGEYQFVYAAFGPKAGLFGGLLWIAATAVAGVTVSIALAGYLNALIPFAPRNAVAALACIAFMTVDVLGLRFSSRINNLLVLIKLGVILLFIVLTIPFFRISNFSNFFSKGSDGVLAAAFLIFFAYAGFGKITAAGEEVKDAARTIPKAIVLAVSIAAVLYILLGLLSVGAVGAEALNSPSYVNAPLAAVIQHIGYRWGFFVVAIGALAATASVLLIEMLGLSRTIYGMSANKQLPRFFSKVHKRFGTPYRANIFIGILMALMAYFVSTMRIIFLSGLGILTYYAIINLAALKMRKQPGGFNVPRVVHILGFFSCIFLILYFLTTLL